MTSLRHLTRTWRGAIVAGALLAGCAGSESIPLPEAAGIGTIEICRNGCKSGKLASADAAFIAQAARALAAFRGGWQTEWQMQLSTMSFSFPPVVDSVAFRDKSGRVVFTLWFGADWVGAVVGQQRYFRKVRQSEVAPLRTALRMARP